MPPGDISKLNLRYTANDISDVPFVLQLEPRGRSPAILKRFESLGYDVLDYRGYFGHGYYWRLSLLNKLEGKNESAELESFRARRDLTVDTATTD